jgi:hypothetical protein
MRSFHLVAPVACFVFEIAYAENVEPVTLGSGRLRAGRKRLFGSLHGSIARDANLAVAPAQTNSSGVHLAKPISSGLTRFSAGLKSFGSEIWEQLLRFRIIFQDKILDGQAVSSPITVETRLRIIELFVMMVLVTSAAAATRMRTMQAPTKNQDHPVGYVYKLQQLGAQPKANNRFLICVNGELR